MNILICPNRWLSIICIQIFTIKKYLKQNETVIGFNRDRSFNDVIDALLYIAIKDLPESTVKPVLKEYALSGSTESTW